MYKTKKHLHKYLVVNDNAVYSEHCALQDAQDVADLQNYRLAIELYQYGEVDLAWEVAQSDTGLRAGVTKEQWVDYVKSLN